MTIEHSIVTDPDIHEPKGISTAVANKVYVAISAGAGAWMYPTAHGSVSYVDLTTGTTYVTPTVYTKLAPTTVASGSAIEVTEATTAKTTYTGTPTRHVRISANVTVGQTAGASRPLTFAVYKNGSILANSEIRTEITGSTLQNVFLHYDGTVVTNDYFEVYAKITGTGNIVVYTMVTHFMAVV